MDYEVFSKNFTGQKIETKKISTFHKCRKMKFKKLKKYDFNLIVIGAGSAGLVCSYLASALKAKVALVEKHKMGGDCLNTGCIPSKSFIRSAKILSLKNKAKELGFKSLSMDYEFQDIMERVKNRIKKIEPHDSVERYKRLGVHCFSATAEILSPYEVRFKDKVYSTKAIVVATGARPKIIPFEGLNQISYRTSDNIWELKTRPKRLLVLGGGPIGCELAQSFQRLGSQVIIVDMAPRIVAQLDEKVSEILTCQFYKEGMEIFTSHQVEKFTSDSEGKFLTVRDPQGHSKKILFDEVLIALGREARVKGFGLENLGVKITKQGTVQADLFMATNYPNIFVCGDVTGPFQFTHIAAYQAYYACVNALFSPYNRFLPSWIQKKFFKANYDIVPWALYTDPEIATAGLSKAQAEKQSIPYESTVYNFEELDRAITDSEDQGYVEVLTPPGKDKILGVIIVHSRASEIIAEFVLAMTHNLGLGAVLNSIHIYPTLGEGNKYLAGRWKKNHQPEKILNLLQKFHSWRRG